MGNPAAMRTWLYVALAFGCSKHNDSMPIDAPSSGPDAAQTCGTGDDCNISKNSGCNPDDRCALTLDQVGSCWFGTCETTGAGQLGDPCNVTDNNEGAEFWDNCSYSLVCYQGSCAQACGDGGMGCQGSAQCMQDPEVGGFALDICVD